MNFFQSIVLQLRNNIPEITVIFIVAVFLIATVMGVHLYEDVPLSHLTRDPNSIFQAPLYTGFLSQIGIFIWSAASAITLFCGYIISRAFENSQWTFFFYASAGITILLGVDDAFLIHDSLLPYFGVPEEFLFILYGILVMFFILKFFNLIMKTPYILFIIGLGFFGLSMLVDKFGLNNFESTLLLEDSTKLGGIVGWTVYFFRVGSDLVSEKILTENPRFST